MENKKLQMFVEFTSRFKASKFSGSATLWLVRSARGKVCDLHINIDIKRWNKSMVYDIYESSF
jgi:hypothetical protein